MSDDDWQIYNRELIALARTVETPARLDAADVTARATSPICGSDVTIDLRIVDGKVTAIGYAVEACALTKSVVAVMKTAAIGKTQSEIAAGGTALEKMLEDGTLPSGDWATLSILLPVRDYKARHNAILLPFRAAEKAFLSTENTQKSQVP